MNLSSVDKVEHVSEVTTILPTSSDVPTLSGSSTLVGEQNKRGSKISSLEDKRQQ